MRFVRNILSALSFKPTTYVRPEWIYGESVLGERAIPDELWSTHFNAWS